MHGDLGQSAREKALKAFRTGDIDVLVATDVAARGIDIDDITHVINYQIPEDEQAYVHRIGRTGRAGKTGIAVTLVDWDELPRWTMIDKALGLDNPDPAETYSSSPHLYDELDIPTDATGTVGPATRTSQDRQARRRATRDRRAADSPHAQPQPHAAAHPRRQAGDRPLRRREPTGATPAARRPTSPPQSGDADGAAGAAAAARSKAAARNAPASEVPPLDGQTRTPHQGRPAGGRGDRRRGRRRRRR